MSLIGDAGLRGDRCRVVWPIVLGWVMGSLAELEEEHLLGMHDTIDRHGRAFCHV
jgi:hypothetical protein